MSAHRFAVKKLHEAVNTMFQFKSPCKSLKYLRKAGPERQKSPEQL
jgi:hypothetical protein